MTTTTSITVDRCPVTETGRKLKKAEPMLGAVLYRGPHPTAEREMLVIASNLDGRGSNAKVGVGTIQTWTLVEDMKPSEAVRCGDDHLICGNCPHRSGSVYEEPGVGQIVTSGRSCYVTPECDGPDKIWKQVQESPERYYQPCELPETLLDGAAIRICQYGDPAFAPFEMWEDVVTRIRATEGKVIGYTHQWRKCDQRFRRFLMASVDNLDQLQDARAAGWRTARTAAWDFGERPQQNLGEFTCPATDEAYANRRLRAIVNNKTAPKPVTCETCGFCDGTRDGTRSAPRGVVFPVHGCTGRPQAYLRHRRFDK